MNEALWLQLVFETMKIEHMDIVNEKYNNKSPNTPINMQKMIEKWSKTTNGQTQRAMTQASQGDSLIFNL